MSQMWLLWWPKTTTTTTTTITSTSQKGSSQDSNCGCMSKKTVSKLLKKLKKHGAKMLHHSNFTTSRTKTRTRTRPSSPSSFQCRYDPLSYSLNFDTTGSGCLLNDEDHYYKFYAFSSRFVATSKPSSSPTSQA